MFTPFIICFREGIEIFLVLIPLIIYFSQKKQYDMSASIVLGGLTGSIGAGALGLFLFTQASLLDGAASEILDGALGIILAALILYSVVLLRKSVSIQTAPDEKLLTTGTKGLFIIGLVTVLRELLEVVLFLFASPKGTMLAVAGSSFLGLLCAAALVWLVVKGLSRLSLGIVFQLLNLFLIALGAYCFGDGLEVLFGTMVPEIFRVGVLLYAVPCYILVLKKDLKQILKKQQIK